MRQFINVPEYKTYTVWYYYIGIRGSPFSVHILTLWFTPGAIGRYAVRVFDIRQNRASRYQSERVTDSLIFHVTSPGAWIIGYICRSTIDNRIYQYVHKVGALSIGGINIAHRRNIWELYLVYGSINKPWQLAYPPGLFLSFSRILRQLSVSWASFIGVKSNM